MAVQEAAQALGVNSTPTFIINDEVYTNRPYQDLVAILEPLLPPEMRKSSDAETTEEAAE